MNVYYVAGIPYSDELYHHGIKGQKWGVRRYQNSDGSLTSFGRIRYGVGKAASGVGHAGSSVVKKIGSFAKKKYKRMRPSAMTDAELAAATKRIKMETDYRKAVNEMNSQKISRRFASSILKIVNDSASELAKTAAKSVATKLVERAFESKDSARAKRLRAEGEKYDALKKRSDKKLEYEKTKIKNDTESMMARNKENLEKISRKNDRYLNKLERNEAKRDNITSKQVLKDEIRESKKKLKEAKKEARDENKQRRRERYNSITRAFNGDYIP